MDTKTPPSIDRCPACTYDLTGLGAEGNCPECGFAYDPTMWSMPCVDLRQRTRNSFWIAITLSLGLAFIFGNRVLIPIAVLAGLGLLEYGLPRLTSMAALVVSARGIELVRPRAVRRRPIGWRRVRRVTLEPANGSGRRALRRRLRSSDPQWTLRVRRMILAPNAIEVTFAARFERTRALDAILRERARHVRSSLQTAVAEPS